VPKAIYLGAALAMAVLCGPANAANIVFSCGSGLVNTSTVDICPGISAPSGAVITDVVLSYSLQAVSPNGPDGQLAPATLDLAAPAGFSSPNTSYEFTGTGVEVITVTDGPAEDGLSVASFNPFDVSIVRAPEADFSANTFASVSVTYTLAAATSPSAVPEPMIWAMMLCGFGVGGAALRFRQFDPVVDQLGERPSEA
jgi:hypothetical protein